MWLSQLGQLLIMHVPEASRTEAAGTKTWPRRMALTPCTLAAHEWLQANTEEEAPPHPADGREERRESQHNAEEDEEPAVDHSRLPSV